MIPFAFTRVATLFVLTSVTLSHASELYSRQIAGNSYDSLARIVVDAQGYVYATGSTASTDFAGANAGLAGTNGALDVFVLKLSPSGQIVYAKLVGGSGPDYGNDLAIDNAGNVYVVATSYSEDFPLTAGSRPGFSTNGDAVVFKLDAAGSTVLYAIGFGGAHYDVPSGIAVTANGEAVVAGVTYSSDFPASAGALQTMSTADGAGYSGDAFVVRVAASGSNLVYSTYLGGTQADGAVDVALDSAGNAYVAGYTASAEFPVTANAAQKDLGGPEGIFSPYSSDVFLTKLGPGGALLYSTFWGTSDSEEGLAIAVDSQDRVYVGGGVGNRIPIRAVRLGGGIPFPSPSPPPPPGAFVFRVDTDGAAPAYIKRFGGTPYDRLSDLAVGPGGNVHFIANLGKSLRAELDAGGSDFVDVAPAPFCGSSFAAIAVGPSGDVYVGANAGPADYTTQDVVIERLAPHTGAPTNSPPVAALYLSSNFGPLSSLETLTFRADGADVGGTLQSLGIYSGGQLLGTSTGFPYNFSWTNPPAGSHTLYAVATDNFGARGTSCPVNVTILSPPANDSFYSSARLEGTSLTITGSTAGATSDRGEPMANFQYTPSTPRTIWYCWTAPANGPVAIELNGLVNLSVFTGNDLEHLTGSHGDAYYGYPDTAAAIAFKATAGVTYRLVVYSYSATPFTLTLRPANPPANDDYANRIVLTGESVMAEGSNLDATREDVLPPDKVDNSSSVWWTWTAPSDGAYRFSTDKQLWVFSAVPGYPNIIASRGPSADIRAVAGEQFDLMVSQVSGVPGDFQLSIKRLTPPVNDNFAERILLSGTNVTVEGSVDGATAEALEPMHNTYSATASVWYSWIAPTTGVARVRLSTFLSSATLAVYAGSVLSDLTSVTWASSYDPEVTVPIIAGTPYQIAVDISYGGLTNFALSIQTREGPANDAFANRIALSGSSVTAFGNTVGATLEPNEPQHSQSSSGSIWYSWVAPSNAVYTVMAFGPWPVAAVYMGSDLTVLSRVTPTNGFTYSPYFAQFAAVTGVQYQIAVAGYSGGLVRLQVRPATPPSNDNFADRAVVSGENLAISGSTIDATTEPVEPAPEDGVSVWFTWTVPRTSQYAFSLWPQSAALSYEVYTGTNLAELTAITSVYSQNDVKFLNLVAGQSLQIRVFGDLGQQTPFTLDVVRADAPPNDHFSNATVLNGSSVEVLGYTRAATTEVNEPPIYPPPQTPYHLPSAWWSWTAPASGRTTVETGSGRSRFMYVHIYTGNSLGSLTLVTNNLPLFPWQPAAIFDAIAGTTYRIRVSGYFDAQFLLSLSGPTATIQPRLTDLRMMEDGRVHIDFSAAFGRPTVIEASTNTADWVPISTNIVDCLPFQFTDPEAHSRRFYRLRTF